MGEGGWARIRIPRNRRAGWRSTGRSLRWTGRSARSTGRNIVGTTTTRSTRITIPGGTAKLGYVDDVAVIPTHRRRGILTGIMRSQLAQMRERGQPMAALGASESLIYERFGFGHRNMVRPGGRSTAGTRCSRSRLKAADTSTLWTTRPRETSGPGYMRALPLNIRGWSTSTQAYWAASLRDFGGLRPGTSEFFHVAYRRGERVSGLVSYRIRDGSVLAIFLLGEDSEVEAELWRYCFGIDLMSADRGVQPADGRSPCPGAWKIRDGLGEIGARPVVASIGRR